jgi:hypothetical protein
MHIFGQLEETCFIENPNPADEREGGRDLFGKTKYGRIFASLSMDKKSPGVSFLCNNLSQFLSMPNFARTHDSISHSS